MDFMNSTRDLLTKAQAGTLTTTETEELYFATLQLGIACSHLMKDLVYEPAKRESVAATSHELALKIRSFV